MSVKLGITGVRGRFFELNPEIVLKLSQAFSSYIGGGDIAVAMDTRPSGKFIMEAVISGLMSSGATVCGFKILPTPILQWIIKGSEFRGGISITAAHNSFKWNSLIFLNEDGAYLSPLEVEEFFSLYHSGNFSRKKFNEIGLYRQNQSHVTRYFKALAEQVGQAGRTFKFALDCSNGATGKVWQQFADSLDIQIVPLFCKSGTSFKKSPEPNLANAEVLATVVRETQCDGGFLLNSDATRVLLVDEKGRPFSEELTLPLLTRIILSNHQSNVVTTFSTSKMVDRVAQQFGAKVYRTDVGPPSVVQYAIDMKAEIGGEGSGSIVYTPFSYGYDSFLFIAKMIDYLSKMNISLSDLADEFACPQTYKETFFLPAHKIYSILGQLEKLYPAKTKLRDGFYFEKEQNWLCIRASSTMSMIRIVGEGEDILAEIEKIKEHIK